MICGPRQTEYTASKAKLNYGLPIFHKNYVAWATSISTQQQAGPLQPTRE